MNMQEHILSALSEQLDRWEALLSGLSQPQITAPLPPGGLSIKDEIAHLWTWQQRSIARLEAARLNREPQYPHWLPGEDPEADGSPDRINAWIYATCRHLPWSQVHPSWRAGFLRFLELGDQVPERELLDADRFPWLEGYSLADVLLGSYEHHLEHLESLQARLAPPVRSGLAPAGNARIYYETAGQGTPLVMIHAGVADSRMWNNEFALFARDHRVLRYDQRGFGQSQPAEGEYSPMGDLVALLDHLELHQPLVLMGCSMGGGLAMDFALAHPGRLRALVMVGSGPSGLDLDVPQSEKFAQVERAFAAGDLDRAAELETQIWFDGVGRSPEQVDPAMRLLAYEMDRLALAHEVKGLGVRLPNTDSPAFDRLAELKIPVLLIVGAQDEPYSHAAADYMLAKLPSARKAIIDDAAHLPNMDHPQEFQRIVKAFLDELG